MTPEIKAAIEKKRAASVASKIAHDAWTGAARVAREAEAAAESAHTASMDASTDLHRAVVAEFGAEATVVGIYHGDLYVCIGGREMTYDEAVAYFAKRKARKSTDAAP